MPTYVSINAGNTVEASIYQSRIGSRANIREHEEDNTIESSICQSGLRSRANIHEQQEDNTVEASIFRSGIDSRPIYLSINISGLVKLVGCNTL